MTDLDRMKMNDEAAFYALHQDLKPYGKIIAEDGYLAGYEKGFEEVTARLEKQKEINKELIDLQEETIKTFNRTIEEVKCLLNDLLDNSDEYARQRARDYLERAKQ